jgi:hypothetical protein
MTTVLHGSTDPTSVGSAVHPEHADEPEENWQLHLPVPIPPHWPVQHEQPPLVLNVHMCYISSIRDMYEEHREVWSVAVS